MIANNFAIAIDGPVGVGKSTTAKLVANMLGITYIDTGAMYRATALYYLQNNKSNLKEIDDVDINLHYKNGVQHVFLNGEDVTNLLRTQEISALASQVIAVNSKIREKLVGLQREMAKTSSVVMDGRDIGSHVLPWAQVKIYLDASPEIRANRRAMEQKSKGESSDFAQILQETIDRDKIDKNRPISPLIKTDDAIAIDTGHMNPEEVAAKIVKYAKEILQCSTNS